MLLHSAVKGAGAPNNIWLHGFLGTGQIFYKVARGVFGTNYMLDLPNHGNSFHARYKTPYEQVSNDILKFAEANQIEKFNLIGHNLGGRIAMHTANIAPKKVQKVVALDIAPIDLSECHKNINAVWKHILMQMSQMNLEGKTKNQLERELREITKDKNLAWYLGNSLGGTSKNHHWKYDLEYFIETFDLGQPWTDFDPKIINPGLAIFGGDSFYTVLNPFFKDMLHAFDRNFENWKYEIIPGGDHFVHASRQVSTVDKINSFITS